MYTEELPLASLKKIHLDFNDTLTIQIQKRKARLVSTLNPPQDNVWVYRTYPATPLTLNNYLGPILSVNRGSPCKINWTNTLRGDAINKTQEPPPINVISRPGMMADMMQPPVGVVTHLHGARVKDFSDGWPLVPLGYVNNPHGFFSTRQYPYPNDQRATMLWYHDHSMDNTAPNVHAGLAGLYFIRDTSDEELFELLDGAYEIPLVIQDKILNATQTAFNYDAGMPVDPNDPPNRRPEFLGDVIFVNGRPQPHCHVERRVYRLRLLNGSNARTYALALHDPHTQTWYTDRMRVIGTDGGLLTKSVVLGQQEFLVLAPAERRDVLIDLTGLTGVSALRLVNLAVASLVRLDSVEGIFTYGLPRLAGDSTNSVLPVNLRTPANLSLSQANILEFRLSTGRDRHKHFDLFSDVDELLAENAWDDDFCFDGITLQADRPVARNRLILLMNNVLAVPPAIPNIMWQDVQMWEMDDNVSDPISWDFPFDVDVTNLNPAAGNPVPTKTYRIARSTFLDPAMMGMPMPGKYPPVFFPPTIRASAGSYERWYVANIGNEGLGTATSKPDMHPFHVHLVNFIVLRRWLQDANTGQFIQQTQKPLDGIARHDTIAVESNELLELLLYFPPGYTGNYVYHCHLVEHEDMGMMLHFSVS